MSSAPGSRKLRGAIIGLGNIALRGHVPAWAGMTAVSSRAEIVAVMDVVPQNRERSAEVLPGAKFYSDLPALLKSEQLDFVDICTPPHTHADYIRACAAKNIHILCEKPLAESVTPAAGIREAVAAGRVVFVPCHQYKYSPLWKTIHDVIASKRIGQVSFAQFNVFRLQADTGSAAWNPAWRTDRKHSGGGILVDTGAHYFYLAQYFFGVPKKVSAVLRTLGHKEYAVEDTAVVTLDYGSTLMQINLTWAASSRANSAFVVGSGGSLTYDGSKLLLGTAGGTEELPMPDVSDKNQYIRWYASLFAEFIRRIDAGDHGEDLIAEAVLVMRLLELSYRASGEGLVLDVA